MRNNAPVEHCAAEAQSRAQGFKPMLKTSLFCTFLIDLRHENPVLKIEILIPLNSRILLPHVKNGWKPWERWQLKHLRVHFSFSGLCLSV
jgi:hypothetical protein